MFYGFDAARTGSSCTFEGEDGDYLCRRQEGPVVPPEKVCGSLGQEKSQQHTTCRWRDVHIAHPAQLKQVLDTLRTRWFKKVVPSMPYAVRFTLWSGFLRAVNMPSSTLRRSVDVAVPLLQAGPVRNFSKCCGSGQGL